MRKYTFIFLLLLSGTSFAAQFSVGVNPSVVELGDVNAGDQKIVKFSIFSVSDETLLVYLSSENGNMDFFNKGYTQAKNNFSEEDSADWLEFLANPVEIKVGPNRTTERTWTEVNTLLEIPADAEPGYHVIGIIPQPTVFGDPNAPIGTTIVTVTKVFVFFNVRGPAKRSGVILDSTAHEYNGGGFKLKTFFQNTGTDTLYSRAVNDIYSENGSFVGRFTSPFEYAEPGTMKVYETPVNENMEEGTYKVLSKVTFTTGQAEKESAVNLYVPTGSASIQQAPEQGPSWFIISISIIIIIIIIILLAGRRHLNEKNK